MPRLASAQDGNRTPARRRYRGRFAPSPTGPLHQGSLVGALASYLDARAHRGDWLLRIEDIDGPRTMPGADREILATLRHFGFHWDETPLWQSRLTARYQRAFGRLNADGWIYPCGCTRREIADSLAAAQLRHATLAYPGTCRCGLRGRPARAWRVRVDAWPGPLCYHDRYGGQLCQDLATEVGDFVLKRADGQWAYQLAVVVDDGAAGITDVVRGEDLRDSTPRQLYLQRLLGLPAPRYLHVPVVREANGDKLSKQTGAPALDRHGDPLPALRAAARHLGLDIGASSLAAFHREAVPAWAQRWLTRPR
ncbi:tRNA glutamyl-Q(34) synthetase GluQRS [Chitinasiproducens palmae]|nr:tRNA glutamyl-Q(34) synthetase GluQRS [Chitinasiproducens palmae]